MSEGLDAAGFALGPPGQIVLGVADLARAEAFYGEALGLRRIEGDPERPAYDGGEVRIVLQARGEQDTVRPASPIYFKVYDIRRARAELQARGVRFVEPVLMTAALDDHDLWTTAFVDPDGHRLALTMEGPKGFAV